MNEHLAGSAVHPTNLGGFPLIHKGVEPTVTPLLKILLTTTVALFALTAIVHTKPTVNGTAAAANYPPAATQKQWEAATRVFDEIGATFRPYNLDQPNLMVATLRPGTSITRDECQRLVNSARTSLGPFSLVVLHESNGHILARTTPAGVR